MRLATRLLAHSSAQLVVFGLLVGFGYNEVRTTVVPMLEDSLRDKARSSLTLLASELEVPLGADDRSLVAKAVEAATHDPDFRYLEVTDAKGAVRFHAGTAPPSVARTGAPRSARLIGDTVEAWSTVSIEGVTLGDVMLVYDDARVERMRAWIRAAGAAALIVWLAILAYSIAFSRAFVRPIRSMMQFTHDVAGGQLGTRLDTPAPGELAELKDDLNQMACELAERQAAQQRAAAKEAELRQELMQVSRMAGMAEVATGVLHNVGNVLNSLNVSVSVVGDRLKQSKVASLTRTVEMFGQHPDGLPGLLTTDKGKLIPQFLTSVAQRLVEENTLVRTELANVASNVDHIKAIVATQQSYAQVAGVAEPVELAGLPPPQRGVVRAPQGRGRPRVRRRADAQHGSPQAAPDRDQPGLERAPRAEGQGPGGQADHEDRAPRRDRRDRRRGYRHRHQRREPDARVPPRLHDEEGRPRLRPPLVCERRARARRLDPRGEPGPRARRDVHPGAADRRAREEP